MIDVSPYLVTDTEVGVCLALPDGNAIYLTQEEWDATCAEADDALVTDPALLHNAIAAEKRLNNWKDDR